jgi:hypothetical protein
MKRLLSALLIALTLMLTIGVTSQSAEARSRHRGYHSRTYRRSSHLNFSLGTGYRRYYYAPYSRLPYRYYYYPYGCESYRPGVRLYFRW